MSVGDQIAGVGMPVLWPKPDKVPPVPTTGCITGRPVKGRLNVVIYGVGLLAACMLVGVILGDPGATYWRQANVGGVGIAMLLLLWATNASRLKPLFAPPTATGITFWSAMYIPIVVAMAAKQNVLAAV